MAEKNFHIRLEVKNTYSDRTIKIVFPNGEAYNVPGDVIVYHHAVNVSLPVINKTLDDALAESAIYFKEHPFQLTEYCRNAMGWMDVILAAEHVNELGIKGRIEAWAKADIGLLLDTEEFNNQNKDGKND